MEFLHVTMNKNMIIKTMLILLILVPIGLSSQPRCIEREDFHSIVTIPAIMFDLMYIDTIPTADIIDEYFIQTSPCQNHPFLLTHSANIQWTIEEEKLVPKYIIRKGKIDIELTDIYNKEVEEKGDDFRIRAKDGEYKGIKSPLPYFKHWVGREGRTFQVKNEKLVSQSDWPLITDHYFKYAHSQIYYRKIFRIILNNEQLMAGAQLYSSSLMNYDFMRYLEKQPIILDDSLSISLNCIAEIDSMGKIMFFSGEKKHDDSKKELLDRLNGWAQTLDPFAFNGFYTLNGLYLPFRVFQISYTPQKTMIYDRLEVTKRFKNQIHKLE